MGGAAATIGVDPRRAGCDWETPPWLFDLLHRKYNFEVDAAATAENAKLAYYWTEREDGLAQSWRGRTVFCNPPYGRETGRWVRKAAAERPKGCPLSVLIVPVNAEVAWWHDVVLRQCNEILFIRGRVRFLVDGKENDRHHGRPRFATAVLVFKRYAPGMWPLVGSIEAPMRSRPRRSSA